MSSGLRATKVKGHTGHLLHSEAVDVGDSLETAESLHISTVFPWPLQNDEAELESDKDKDDSCKASKCFPDIHKSSISHDLHALCFTDFAFCVSHVSHVSHVSQSSIHAVSR